VLKLQDDDDNTLEVKAKAIRSLKKDILVVVACAFISLFFFNTESIELHLCVHLSNNFFCMI